MCGIMFDMFSVLLVCNKLPEIKQTKPEMLTIFIYCVQKSSTKRPDPSLSEIGIYQAIDKNMPVDPSGEFPLLHIPCCIIAPFSFDTLY